VLNDGRVEQLGRPLDVYNRPSTVFAARFVGDANVIPVTVAGVDGDRASVNCGGATLAVTGQAVRPGPAWLVVKPQAVRITTDATAGLRGVIEDAAFRGTGFSYRVAIGHLDGGIRAEIGADAGSPLAIGTEVVVSWDAAAPGLLTREGDGT
jgi:ABC-type Fe3+/spermidine/putrescine transport system ATPase subunit